MDVASVGSESGPGNGDVFSDIVSRFGDMSWITGGGIRDLKDVRGLVSEGYSAFLIASALLPGNGCWSHLGKARETGRNRVLPRLRLPIEANCYH
ncbi:HisA/HisF-related TIM barrel protein [Rhodopirellula europaea]|uniref:HisA/HisF-related TIM barrel protein n=1 Tax=Rhodopirellula europaea TaxID=1263866 RepID=UPI003D26DCAE